MSEEKRWYKRGATTRTYHVSVCLLATLCYWMLMVVPYLYDQWNRQLYERAKADGALVIREYLSAYETTAIDNCANQPDTALRRCNPKALTVALGRTKLIALDYVEKLHAAQKLSWIEFVRSSAVIFVLLLALIGFLSYLVKAPGTRFLLLMLAFLLCFVGLHWLFDLPHSNTKFYYVVGSMFALLLPLSDYFHHVTVPTRKGSPAAVIASLQYEHRRWQAILQGITAALIALVGTVFFKIVDVETTVFGESFIYYPLLGIVLTMVFSIAVFFWGVFRYLIDILSELEANMASAASFGASGGAPVGVEGGSPES